MGEEGVDAAEVEVDVLQGQHQQPQVREDLRAAASMHHRSMMMMCVCVCVCHSVVKLSANDLYSIAFIM